MAMHQLQRVKQGTFRRFVALACGLLATCGLLAGAAHAQGSVQGVLQTGSQTITPKFATALLHDNAEGLLQGKGRQLRILLSDVDLGPAGLQGIAFVPATVMAREGKVRGLILTLAPDNPNEVLATVLEKPEGGFSLANITLTSKPDPVIANYKMDGKIVSGSIKLSSADAKSSGIGFSAPIQAVPAITADLKGKAALESEQVKSMRARVQAMIKGDSEAVAKLATPVENRQVEAAVAQMGPEAKNMMRSAGREMLPALNRVERVVVRGDRAVVIFKAGEAWQEMALIDGQWKTGK
jgi:hypothetical protein